MQTVSPTTMSKYLACPTLAMLDKDGWRTREFNRGDVAAAFGSAMAYGLAGYHKDLRDGGEETPEVYVAWAMDHFKGTTESWEALGRFPKEDTKVVLEAAPDRIEKGMRGYLEADPIRSAGWTVVDVEMELGPGRIDLGVLQDGVPLVADVKWKISLDARYKAKEIASYAASWQMRTYTEDYAALKEQEIVEYAIVLCVLEPKVRVEVLHFPISPESLERWSRGAAVACSRYRNDRIAWSVERVATMNTGSCNTSYGPCPYYRACHSLHTSPDLMLQSGAYVQVERRD